MHRSSVEQFVISSRILHQRCMSAPVLQIFETPEAVAQAAAGAFVRLAREAAANRGRFRVALAGGSTPKRLYQLLAEPPHRDQVDWSKVDFFWGDERSVGPEHPDSNYRMAHEALLSKVPVAESQIHRMPAEWPERDAAAAEYQTQIAAAFGVSRDGEPPQFDLILAGMGADGHTLSLFPDTTALKETSKWVVANWVEKLQTHRMTITTPLTRQARDILFCVTGADKAGPAFEVLWGPADTQRLPSQLLLECAGTVTWLLDRMAAAKLSKIESP